MLSERTTHPHISFIGPGEVTFATEGFGLVDTDKIQGGVHASTVYYPHKEADRNRWTTNERQAKMIFDGTAFDSGKEPDPNSPIPEILAIFSGLYAMTGEQIITIPLSHIEQLFDPKDSLKYILSGQKGIPAEIHKKVSNVLTFLISHGLPYECLGVYGSLQSFLIKSPVNDIDICIYGLEHVPLIKQIIPIAWFRTNPAVVTNQKMRPLHASFCLSPDLWIDLKVVRLPGDQLSYTQDIKTLQTLCTVEGEVIDTLEAYSTPMSYKIRTTDGKVVTISSSRYNYLFLTMQGSFVRVTASETTAENHFIVSDPKIHKVVHLNGLQNLTN